MNIYIRELRAYRKSMIIWSVSIFLLIVMGMGKYTAMSGTDQSFNDMMKSMPKSIQAIMGGGAFDLSTVIGFYAILFLYLVLMATIHAVMYGAGIISKEERDKTVEFLLVKPVSRHQVITSKLLAVLTNIIIINLVTFLSSIAITESYNKGDSVVGDVFKLMIGLFLLQLLFASIGALLAAFRNNHKLASGIGSGVLLTTYFLSVVSDMSEKLEFLRFITPFKYFDAKTLLIEEGFNPLLVILTILMTAVFTYFTYNFYNKRDLGH